MKSRRTVIIGLALLLAVFAFVGTVYYTQNVRSEAYEGAQLVKVYKVKQAIAKGTDGGMAITQSFVAESDIPQEFRPGSAITNIRDIENKVALTDLSANQILVEGMFVDPTVAQITSAERIPSGQVAVTISLDSVRSVAGLLMPGDKVNVMVSGKEVGVENSEFIQTVYQNVNILAIGTKTVTGPGDTSEDEAAATTGDAGLITFAVPLEAAERIAFASSGSGSTGSSIYLALVRSDNTPIEAPVKIDNGNLFNPGQPTPYND